MIETLCHRGPDESGVYLDDQVGLGHARLSIIDLTSGVQPIHPADYEVFGRTYLSIEFLSELRNIAERRNQWGKLIVALKKIFLTSQGYM
jgi:asparagine synthase (glutamine-hydrolysing)